MAEIVQRTKPKPRERGKRASIDLEASEADRTTRIRARTPLGALYKTREGREYRRGRRPFDGQGVDRAIEKNYRSTEDKGDIPDRGYWN